MHSLPFPTPHRCMTDPCAPIDLRRAAGTAAGPRLSRPITKRESHDNPNRFDPARGIEHVRHTDRATSPGQHRQWRHADRHLRDGRRQRDSHEDADHAARPVAMPVRRAAQGVRSDLRQRRPRRCCCRRPQSATRRPRGRTHSSSARGRGSPWSGTLSAAQVRDADGAANLFDAVIGSRAVTLSGDSPEADVVRVVGELAASGPTGSWWRSAARAASNSNSA